MRALGCVLLVSLVWLAEPLQASPTNSLFPVFPQRMHSGSAKELRRSELFYLPKLSLAGPRLGISDFISLLDPSMALAIETLILEAVGEGYEGMVAVGEVVRRRALLWGRSYAEVCLQPYQFSAWNDKKKAAEFLEKHKAYYETALRAWVESGRTDLTKGASDYHADTVLPYWARCYLRVAKVGRHVFYRRA